MKRLRSDAGHDARHDVGVDSGHDANVCASCGPKQDCVSSACVACTPSVIEVATGSAPPLPAGGSGGLKITCEQNGFAGPCPVVVCGQVDYWFFSDIDNSENLYMVGYYPGTTVYSGPVTIGGNRYVTDATVNLGAQTVTITGQAGATVEPFSFFQ